MLKFIFNHFKLYRCVDEFNDTIRFFVILYFWLAFTTLSIYVAILISNGINMESTQIIFCLFYIASLTVALCVIGQHLKDSVGSARSSLYLILDN